MAADYIPRPNSDFDTFQHNLVNQVSANASSWAIPLADVGELAVASAKYRNCYKAITAKSTRTMGQVATHNQERLKFEKQLRQFVNSYIRSNTKITDAQMTSMRLSRKRKKRKVREKIEEAPVVHLKLMGGQWVKIFCNRANHDGKSYMHPEADGLELRYSLGSPVTLPEQASGALFSKKAKNVLTLPFEAQGKKLYVFARWLNLTHPERSSPWSEVKETVVY